MIDILKEQTKIVQKQSKQEEKKNRRTSRRRSKSRSKKRRKRRRKRRSKNRKKRKKKEESKIDSSKCEEVISETELSKVEVSFSIKLKTSNKFIKCFIFEVTKKDDFVV